MMNNRFLLIVIISCNSAYGFSQDVENLLKAQVSMDSCLKKEDYAGTIKYADFLIDYAPKNSDLHAWGYLKKVTAQHELGDYRNVIINSTKALSLNTELALMVRQPDLPELVKKIKSLNYLVRGMAKESIGLTESAEIDILKSRENKR